MRLLLLPSAHGRGHLKRTALLARELASLGHEVVGPDALARVHREESPDARPFETVRLPPLDFGARLWTAFEAKRLDEELPVLEAQTADAQATWKDAIRASGAHAVVVDADPWPALGASALGIPTVLASNFTWADLVAAWTGAVPPRLLALHEGLHAAQLPFSLGLRGVGGRRVGVPHLADPSSSPPPGSAPRLRALLALGLGNPPLAAPLAAPGPTDVWVPRDAPVPPLEGDARIVRFDGPPSARMREADVVVTKGSYGTVSECIAARRPMLLVPRPEGPEDALFVRTLVAAGVARADGRLPDRGEAHRMAARYDGNEPWMRCDPRAVALAVAALAAHS